MGHRIDMNDTLLGGARPIRFTFDGKSYSGFKGETLASALIANNVVLMGRSFKYHRPRGAIGAWADEPNALVEVGIGGRKTPNLRATQVELYDGLEANSQNRWPSLDRDVGAVNSVFSRLFSAGFYYKTFMWPRPFWHSLYEPFIRRAAGLGRAAEERDPDTYEHYHAFADVVIVGAGPAGLATARAAADHGTRVLLMEDQPVLGGRSREDGGFIDGEPAHLWCARLGEELAAMDNVTVLTRTCVTGHYDHSFLMAAQRLTDHVSIAKAKGPRQRLWKIRTRQTVLASGALERPLTFANNDRPGIMLASAVRTHLAKYGVAPGRNLVVFTNNDDAYRTAIMAKDAGMMVRIVDVRDNCDGDLVRAALERGIKINWKSAIATAKGDKRVTGVQIGPVRESGRMGDPLETIACDSIAMSGGWNPAVHLFSHCGGKLRFDEALATFLPDHTNEPLRVAGSANGAMDLRTVLMEGFHAGAGAARDALDLKTAEVPATPDVGAVHEAPLKPFWFLPSVPPYAEGNKHFVDFQNDVTAADIELAAREGYQSIEHTKRYTTLGMATDQGRLSNINGLALLADALGKPIPAVGTTTFRPPYTPLAMGAITGAMKDDLFHVVRKTPISDWSNANGADNEPVGDWRRPFCYRKPGENRERAVAREVLAVREKAGLLDASTLGKIEVRGPDAGELLDRLYTNKMSNLAIGKCRYGLMMNDSGFLWDDGVVARLGEDRFLLHTTSGNAARVHAHLEEWLQTEWFGLRLYINDVTEQWGQIAVAGPKARTILEKLDADIDWSKDAFPFMTWREGSLAGVTCRVFRISFSGELSYEIAIPAHAALHLWKVLHEAGRKFGIAPYGTEALHILRAEKGFIMIGDETDGTVTPLDLNMDWAVSKKKPDYIGKYAVSTLVEITREDRWTLVGLETDDPSYVLPSGAYAVREPAEAPPMKTIGRVTSSYMSPTLKRSIAMALVEKGADRMGEVLHFPMEDGVRTARIVDPVFHDKEGIRQDV